MKIPLFKINYGETEKENVFSYLNSNLEKNQIGLLENDLKKIHNVKHVVCVSSGTQALYILYKALGLEKNELVFTPNYTWPSCSNVAAILGGTPVLMEPDEISYNVPVKVAEETILKHQDEKLKFLILIHQFGLINDYKEYKNLANRFGLILIEDSAWSLGSKHELAGKAGILSFHPRKLISSGEGGAIYTNDDKLAERCRLIRNHGLNKNGQLILPCLNSRISEIQAILIRAQLKRIKKLLQIRQDIGKSYYERLKSLTSIELTPWDSNNMYQAFPLTIKNKTTDEVTNIIKEMGKKGIEIKRASMAAHLEPWYRENLNLKQDDFPISTYLRNNSICLPMFEELSVSEIDEVVENLQKFL
jgi:perosamine synthetase